MVGFPCGSDDPDVLFLQQTHGARQVGDADQRDVLRRAAGHFLRRRIQLSGTIFWHDHRMHAGGVSATQAGAEVVRIGYAVEDQQERLIELRQQIRQIVLLILTPRLHAGNDPLVHSAFALLIKKLTVGQLNHHALRFQGMDQRQQALILTAFQNINFLKTLRCALQQCLHRMDAVNHFTH